MYNLSSGEYFDLGEVSSLHEGNPWIVNSLSPLNFTITYYGGSEWNNMTLYVHVLCTCISMYIIIVIEYSAIDKNQ